MSNQNQGPKQAQQKAPASPAKPAEPTAAAAPAQRGRTRCRVELSAIYSDGKQYEPGSIGEFDDADVLDPRLSKFLIPVE